MNEVKKESLVVLDRVADVYCISPTAVETIKEGITDIEMLRDRDAVLEDLWSQFADVPMNPETECIEASFMGWGPGIHREEIWHWFDKRHSKGVAYLLYGEAAPNRATKTSDATKSYVIVKHIFEDYYDGGIQVCGVHQDKAAAFEQFMDECEKMLITVSKLGELYYPANMRVFGSDDYWTLTHKDECGLTQNVVEIFIREVPMAKEE